MWSDQEKKTRKNDRLARSLLIQGLPNEIYSLINNNKTAKDLWDALERHLLGSKYDEQDRKAAILYEYETFKATEGELLLDTYIRYLQVINDLKKCGYSKDNRELNFKFLNNLQPELKQTSSSTSSANKKQEYVKYDDKKEDKKVDETKRDMSKVKCYNCKKEGHFAKDCKKAKMEKVLLDSKKSSSSSDDTIAESAIDHNNSEETANLIDQLIKEFDKKIAKYDKYLNTFSSVRRPKVSSVEWKKKGSSNTSKVNLSSNNHSNLNKNVKRYSRKDLMSCNNSHLKDTRSDFVCNNARNASCNARMNAYDDVNDLFVFDDIVQICLWIIDSGCSKHMTGNRALLTNFVENFLGTVRFGNNDFAVIVGYGDVVIGSMMINKVYYVKGLGHNLFSVGQFCDKGLEVAFQKSTYFVRNENGVDLLTGDCSSNLYTTALNEIALNSSNCLLAKASSSKSWLWHQRLSHLNFATINNLVKDNLVRGLLKMKFEKDHLCSACEQGKIHRKHHKSKTAFASNKPLYLLHMDLCGSMHVESIKGKRYVLVVVDDFSCSQVEETLKKDLEDLFHNFYDEYFDSSKITKLLTPNVETSNTEREVFHKVSESFQGESSSSSINDDVQQSSKEVFVPQTNTQPISSDMIPNVNGASLSHNVFNE
nr:integrase, catalytic region, zinc finger, CCHC-type, peptidase aspartic, catalytic [Tanacetum cinerariifolium]